MAATLSIWLASCATTPQSSPAPKVAPPSPYTQDGRLVLASVSAGETVTAGEDSVLMPFWYWRKVFNYIVDTQAAQEINGAKSPEK
jgi:hypothetical protein